MASTYEKIATTTLGSAGTITFSSIPATYTDLRVILNGKNATASDYIVVRFNGDTGTNYSGTNLSGNGTSVSSYTESNGTKGYWGNYALGSSTTILTLWTMDIFSYAGSTYKTVLCSTSNNLGATGEVLRTVGLYRSTNAITTILILNDGSTNFAVGTTATLYGIKAA